MIEFSVKNQIIKRVDNFRVVAMSKNYLQAHFDFQTDEWTGIKTAIFARKGIPSVNVVIEDNDTCLVPWEWLDTEKNAIGFVSVFSGDFVTANRAAVEVLQSGYERGSIPSPTPDVYSQLLENLEELRNLLDSLDLKYEDSELTLLINEEPQASATIVGGSGIAESKVRELIEEAITEFEDGVPDTLNTLGKLARALGEKAEQSDLESLEERIVSLIEQLEAHEGNEDIHTSLTEKALWNAKLDEANLVGLASEDFVSTAIEQSEQNVLQQVQEKIDELEVPNIQSGRVYLSGHHPSGFRGRIIFDEVFSSIPIVSLTYQGDGSLSILPSVQAYGVTDIGFEFLIQDIANRNNYNAFMNWVAIGN